FVALSLEPVRGWLHGRVNPLAKWRGPREQAGTVVRELGLIYVTFLLGWCSLETLTYIASADDATDKPTPELTWSEPWQPWSAAGSVGLSTNARGRFNVWAPWGLPQFKCNYVDGEAAPAVVEAGHSRVSCPPPKPQCPDGMVALAAGSFEMGARRDLKVYELCLEQKSGDEETCRKQETRQAERAGKRTLKAFCIDRTEVSRAAFVSWIARQPITRTEVTCGLPPGKYHFAETQGTRLVMASDQDPWHALAFASEPNAGPLAHGDLPIVGVTWQAAAQYCSESSKTKKRLPTEEEWEYAARGPHAREYVGGRPPACLGVDPTLQGEPIFGDPAANSVGLPDALCPNVHGPRAVQSEGDSSWAGVLQLAGNASEWTATAAEPRADRPGTFYVVKGGSWQDSRFWIRPATVAYGEPLCPSATIGFRCAADPLVPPPPAPPGNP
ncbi:MAG TPA: SUMF1/EgtB/PvdO family nonheme iron enzyme, partial [Polyangiaceae bacterium]